MITMVEADKLISKASSWSVREGLSDVAIARKLYAFNKDLGYITGGFSLVIMTYSKNGTWEIDGMVVGFSGLLWTYYLPHMSRTYSEIGEMFDAAGPQSLKELISASSGTPNFKSNS